MFLCAEKITAGRAFQLGLFSKIVSADSLDKEVKNLCNSLLYAGPQAIQQSKQLINHVIDFEQIQKINTAKWLAEVQQSDEAKEGITAFFKSVILIGFHSKIR